MVSPKLKINIINNDTIIDVVTLNIHIIIIRAIIEKDIVKVTLIDFLNLLIIVIHNIILLIDIKILINIEKYTYIVDHRSNNMITIITSMIATNKSSIFNSNFSLSKFLLMFTTLISKFPFA